MKRALIFTAKPTETEAVEAQLTGLEPKARNNDLHIYEVYKLRKLVLGTEAVENLEIAIYQTGRGQGNVISATKSIVPHFDPDLVFYIGCAGGEQKHLRVGDVFIPDRAWNYEEGKEKKEKFESRAVPLEPNEYLFKLAMSLAKRSSWRTRIPKQAVVQPKVVSGGVASGNKVLADEDGEIWKFAKSINDEIIAVETECHAFFKAMNGLHRPYLMIRGISDNLSNKNTAGKARDDGRQTKATANAAALAAQMLIELDFAKLKHVRGVAPPPAINKRIVGLWTSTWDFGSDRCEDLLRIDSIDKNGRVSGCRYSKMAKYQYDFDVEGLVYGDKAHLTCIPSDRDVQISVSLVLRPENHFQDTLTGIAIRPLGIQKVLPEVRSPHVKHKDDFWASLVEYKRVDTPEDEIPDLWASFKTRRIFA